MSTFFSPVNSNGIFAMPQIVEFTLDLAQAAGTYDICTASLGSCILTGCIVYVQTAGAIFTSISIQSNDTTPFIILSAGAGIIANLTTGANVLTTWTQTQSFSLRTGKKLQFTLIGVTGTGSLRVSFIFMPLVSGAILI